MSPESKPIISPDAPQPLGVYSPGLLADGWLFLSGQIGIDLQLGAIPRDEAFGSEAKRVFDHLEALCHEAGATLAHIVRLGVFLTDLGFYPELNAIMGERFTPPYPARTVVAVSALPRGARIEADAIVRLPRGPRQD